MLRQTTSFHGEIVTEEEYPGNLLLKVRKYFVTFYESDSSLSEFRTIPVVVGGK